jgi:biopolymer transport protein TolR
MLAMASRRAQRMERRHERARNVAGLSLVSMMDIFTILVFFLLVNSSGGEVLPTTKAVRLPESIAEKSPKPTLVVTVNDEDILVQGRRVASVAAALDAGADPVIEPLKAELDYQSRRAHAKGEKARDITIMGDKEIPYRLLKRIMLTCVRAKYENISLAVLRRDQQG